ncbi:MAG: WD40 repeat domain-containing protein [Trebonia sp.]
MAVATGVAYQASQNAASQRDEAIASQFMAESRAQADTNPTASKIESLAAWHIDPTDQSRYALIPAAASPAIAVLTGHTGYVNTVVFSPDGRTLATGSERGTVQLWDVATRQQIGPSLTTASTEGFVNSVAFSPDGQILVGVSGGGVQLWNLNDIGHALTQVCQQIGGSVTSTEWRVCVSRPGLRPGLPVGTRCRIA